MSSVSLNRQQEHTALTLVCELAELNSSVPLVSVAQCKMLFRCEWWKITGLTLTSQDLLLSNVALPPTHPPSLLLVLSLSLFLSKRVVLFVYLKAGFSGGVGRDKRGCVSVQTLCAGESLMKSRKAANFNTFFKSSSF